MRNKKSSIAIGVVIGLILAMAIMITMFFFMERVEQLESSKVRKAVCKQSVKAYSLAKIAGMDFGTEIKCPTERLSIDDSEEEIIMEKLADAMYNCFDQFHRGTLNLFSDDYKKEKHCAVCHVIEFKEKGKKITSKRFNGYIKTHKIPTGEMTYRDFFLGHSTYDEDKEIEYEAELFDINTEMDYATVFVYGKEGYWSKWEATAGGAIGVSTLLGLVAIPFVGTGSLVVGAAGLAGGTMGGIIGYNFGSDKNADWNSSIILLPYEPNIIKNLTCTYAPVEQDR